MVCLSLDLLYRYYDIRNNITVALRAADIESDQELRKKIFALAIRAELRCEERDIVIERSDSRVRVEFPYRHRIGLPFAGAKVGIVDLTLRASGERAL